MILEEPGARERVALNKALQLAWHSAIPSGPGIPLTSTVGASATVGDLCHAARLPVG